MANHAPAARTWRLTTPVPVREVFAVMEQTIGTTPYRFEVTGPDQAHVVEAQRAGVFGNWRRPRRHLRWIRVDATPGTDGTQVVVTASSNPGRLSPWRSASTVSRALQLVTLLERGAGDRRSVYRDRWIPEGPVTLIASWAGTGYQLFTRAERNAPRGVTIHTATRLRSIAPPWGGFVRVALPDGMEGYVERDQIVAAPVEATRQAQLDSARFG